MPQGDLCISTKIAEISPRQRVSRLQLSGRAVAVVVVAFAVLLVGFTLYDMSQVPGTVTSPVPTSFTVNGRTYTFNYTATTQAEREAGLMNKMVTNSTTMLFAFPSPIRQSFWMFDTNTSLDMIWVSVSGRVGSVVFVQSDAPPCLVPADQSNSCPVYPLGEPPPEASYVIEAKGGFAAANGIASGTTLEFS